LVNKNIHPKIISKQEELGENEMFSGIFPGSGQTKPGAQGKKLASKAKGKCSGKSDWSMADSGQWVEWFAVSLVVALLAVIVIQLGRIEAA
jgi:hypothetical protein